MKLRNFVFYMRSHSKYVIPHMDEIQKDHWEYVHFHSSIPSIGVHKITVIWWENDD